jgi:D-alanyl-D-alanine carboxypeptidase/D-alanyl-D-alanine-endopeptidase (penicillin-binding protein 4)
MKCIKIRILFLALICFSAAQSLFCLDSAKLLRRDLTAIFSNPGISDAQWSAAIFSVDKNELLFEKNQQKLFMPASNNKIITAVAALLRLGPDFRFKTELFVDGAVENGTLMGSLIIAGFGDPSSSTRIGSKDPFEPFRIFAAKLKENKIFAIEGKIIGDGSAFEEVPYGQGWEWDDLGEAYAAPISALQFNENQITVEATPGQEIGSLAQIAAKPLSYPPIDSKILTTASGLASIAIEQDPGTEALRVRGAIPLNNGLLTRSVAAKSPIRYYLMALKQVLSEEGIDTTHCKIEESRAGRPQSAIPLWIHASAPLSELLAPNLKFSMNLFSETLLRVMGIELQGEGTSRKGKEVVAETLAEIGIPQDSYLYADGSGLSRLNLVSTEKMVRLLAYMHQDERFPVFYSAFPVAGVDGTLKNRMLGTRAENNVHAKTGTLSHVSAISGYLKTADGETLAFSIMANNFLGTKALPESIQDMVLVRLARFSRKIANGRSSSMPLDQQKLKKK